MHHGNCPVCRSPDIRGGAMDTAGGDEVQDRYCHACRHLESVLRSEGFAGDWSPIPPAPPRTWEPVELRLLEQIAEDLEAEAPRRVYADWLMERGDPLGTFVDLELRGELSAARTLCDEHWRAWIGPPASRLRRGEVDFERGLWSACGHLHPDALDRPDIAGAPTWVTLRRLSLVSWSTRAAELVARLRGLRELACGGVAPKRLPALPVLERLVARCTWETAHAWIVAAPAPELDLDPDMPYTSAVRVQALMRSVEQNRRVVRATIRLGDIALRFDGDVLADITAPPDTPPGRLDWIRGQLGPLVRSGR